MIRFFRNGLFNKRLIYLFFCCMVMACSPDPAKQENRPPPNVLLILADDLGYGDPGCYGGKDIPTPNIDRLASEGIRFTDANVTCSVCGPSRVSLLSGIYQQRIGCYWNPDLWDSHGWTLPDTLEILPEIMKRAGYVTGHIGKWNISPHSRSYVDEAYDVMLWKGAYYPDEEGTYPGVDRPNFKIEPHGWGPSEPGAEYLTDRLTRQAIRFIENHRQKNFFLYLAYNAPHTPLQADRKYREMFKDLKDEPNRIYAGMVHSLDENIGKILQRIDELGLTENTLVIFTSDNGPARGGHYIPGWPEGWPETLLGSAGPLRGHKAQEFEGGHREPFIVRWPSRLPQAAVFSGLTSTLDLYPTICAAAGIRVSGLDGVNLIPHLTGESNDPPHDTLFWMTHMRGAVRAGEWKLILESDTSRMLYNLKNDPAEQQDLSSLHPDLADQLTGAWRKWSDSFPVSFTDKTKFTIR